MVVVLLFVTNSIFDSFVVIVPDEEMYVNYFKSLYLLLFDSLCKGIITNIIKS